MDTEGAFGYGPAAPRPPHGSGPASPVQRAFEPDAEQLMPVPELEPTGHPDVDAALDRLRELPERPTGAHPELYDGVHQRLQDALAQIDQQDRHDT